MFKRTLTIVLISVILSLSINAQQFILDNITGQVTQGQLPTGTPLYFNFRFNNNSGSNVMAFTNGFRFYSNNGATWTNLTESHGTYSFYTGAFGSMLDGGIFPGARSWDGQEADTFSIGGFCIFSSGIPDGFDEIVLSVGVTFNYSELNKHFGIDSCFYPPGGIWTWNTESESIIPYWNGPHNFTISNEGPPCEDPVFEGCDTSQDVFQDFTWNISFTTETPGCSGFTYSIINVSPVPDGIYSINGFSGLLSFTPAVTDLGNYEFQIQATDGDLITECPTNFNVLESCCNIRGDIDHSGGPTPIGISDLTFFVDYLFRAGESPPCFIEADLNHSYNIQIADLTYLVDFLFNNGQAPLPCE